MPYYFLVTLACGFSLSQVEKMKEIAKLKAKEERKRLESEVRCC